MATVICWSEVFSIPPLGPGLSYWLTWGPDDLYAGAAITVTAVPCILTLPEGATTQVMEIGPISTTAIPKDTGPVDAYTYFGAAFKNAGSRGISSFTVTVSVIKP